MNRKSKPLQKKTENNSKNKLYNVVVSMMNAEFTDANNGKLLVLKVVDVLWMIDEHHNQFHTEFSNGHCNQLPTYFRPYTKWSLIIGGS